MSIKSTLVVTTLMLARIAAADDTSLPWQLHTMTTSNVAQADSAVAVFRDPHGNIDIAETTALSATYQLDDHWAPMIRLGFVGNNAPGAALDGTSIGNPILGARYMFEPRLAVFATAAIPIGSGGGNDPDVNAATSNAASITARPSDEAMFEVNYATATVGADVAYAKRGFTAQAEATLSQSVRVRGEDMAVDAGRTRASLGAYAGMFLGSHMSLGADIEVRRWLSNPTMLDAQTLTAAIGIRGHFHIGTASVHPGLSYTRGFDGLSLHGPTDFTKQTNAVGITIPVVF